MGDDPNFENDWMSSLMPCPYCDADRVVDWTDYKGTRWFQCTACDGEWSEPL